MYSVHHYAVLQSFAIVKFSLFEILLDYFGSWDALKMENRFCGIYSANNNDYLVQWVMVILNSQMQKYRFST